MRIRMLVPSWGNRIAYGPGRVLDVDEETGRRKIAAGLAEAYEPEVEPEREAPAGGELDEIDAMARDALKAAADDLGLDYPSNIATERLRERVREALEA